MVKRLQAIMDRVLVRLEMEEKKTSGGIFFTDAEKKTKNIGIVESVGNDVKSVKKGDKVLFHAFDELPTLEKGIVALRERSLLGKFE